MMHFVQFIRYVSFEYLLIVTVVLKIAKSQEYSSPATQLEGEHNYIASIQRKSDKGFIGLATVITPSLLITACSCLFYVKTNLSEFPHAYPSNYVGVAGFFQSTDERIIRNIKTFRTDKKCLRIHSLGFWVHNCGYVLLETPFMNDQAVTAMPNLKNTQSDYEAIANPYLKNPSFMKGGRQHSVTYGFSLKASNTIIERMVKFLNQTECHSIICKGLNMKTCSNAMTVNNMFCAEEVGSVTTKLCSDEGYPLVCENNLIAVGSHHYSCNENTTTTIYQPLNIEDLVASELESNSQATYVPPLFFLLTIFFLLPKLNN